MINKTDVSINQLRAQIGLEPITAQHPYYVVQEDFDESQYLANCTADGMIVTNDAAELTYANFDDKKQDSSGLKIETEVE